MYPKCIPNVSYSGAPFDWDYPGIEPPGIRMRYIALLRVTAIHISRTKKGGRETVNQENLLVLIDC